MAEAADPPDSQVPAGWERDKNTGKLRPVRGEVLSFSFGGDADGNGEDFMVKKGAPVSLQDGFKGFRKAKIKAARSRAVQDQQANELRKDPAQMQQLRELFIDRCKSYYGVPYQQKYHDANDPCKCGKEGCTHFHSPIFLDCCGLVRQVLRDLKSEFGFETGPWNQAYQFDTLPIRYDTWDKMKPGDLVFAEGKYVKEGVKPQKGNIVHVEVFLGGGPEGKSVCGARWNKGVVQEFDSYEFAPKSWTLTAWHFCSIDTWLEGVCRSFHPDREWKRREWVPGKHSIFAAQEDEEDENAGPADDDDNATIVHVQEDAVGVVMGSESAGSGSVARKHGPKRFYVSRGNQWDLIANALEELGWARIPFDHKDDLTYQLKWTELRSDIDFARFRESEQLANHVPNASVITTKDGLIKSLRALDRAAAQRKRGSASKHEAEEAPATTEQHGPELLPLASFVPKTYVLNIGADKMQMLHDLQEELAQEGEHARAEGATGAAAAGGRVWIVKPMAANQGHGISVTRDARKLLEDYLGFRQRFASAAPPPPGGTDAREEQGARRSEGEEEIDWGREAETACRMTPARAKGGGAEALRVKALEAEGMLDRSPGALYPTNRSRLPPHLHDTLGADAGVSAALGGGDAGSKRAGGGDAIDVLAPCGAAEAGSQGAAGGGGGMFVRTEKGERFIVQEYIQRPLLVKGRKFDLRCYMLIASTKPHFVALFRGGYARLSLSDYSLAELDDRFVHLTNAAVQKKHPDYKQRGDDAIASMEQLQEMLQAEASVPAGWVSGVLLPRMQAISQQVCRAAQAKFVRRRGLFELLGLDFMVDDALTPWLIEVNSNPALWMHSPTQRTLLPALVRDCLHLVLEYNHKLAAAAAAEASSLPTGGAEGAVRVASLEEARKFVVLCDEALGPRAQYPCVSGAQGNAHTGLTASSDHAGAAAAKHVKAVSTFAKDVKENILNAC